MDASGPDFREVFVSAPGLLLLLDAAAPHIVVEASQAYLDAARCSRWELIGRALGDVVGSPRGDARPLVESIERVASSGARDAGSEVELDLCARGDAPVETRWYRFATSPVRHGSEIAWVLCSLEDVSERRRCEEQRELFVSLVENSSDFIGIADPDGKPIFVNRAGRRMIGLSPDYPIETTRIPDYYTPDQRELASTVIVGSMLEHGHWAGETSFRNWQTDAPIPVSDEHFMIRKPGTGAVLGMGTITRDITERKRAESALEVSESRFWELLSDAGAALASSLDDEETLQVVSRLAVRSIAEMCVIDLMEGPGRAGKLSIHHADPRMAETCEKLRVSAARRRLERAGWDGGRRVIDDLAAPTSGAAVHEDVLRELGARSAMWLPLVTGRGPLGVLVVGSTQPGRFSERERAVAEHLADKATLALENARLYAEAHRALRARDEVLGVVAHDLRTPLGSIRLAAGLLERSIPAGEGDRAHRSIETIERGVRRASRLIEDLLDVVRLEGGVLSIERDVVAIGDLVVEVVSEEQLQAEARSLELRIELGDDPLPVIGDHDRLLQVLENLLGNAIKFTPAGGSIAVGASRLDGEVLVRVTDTGPGIPEGSRDHVFDRFWQARRSERRGAGLGLPISKGIVEAHGGRIWVESPPGGGSIFSFTVPAAPRP